MPLVEIRPATHTTPPEPAPAYEPSPLERHLAHFRRRVLVDAILEGTAAYWRQRAATFTAVGTPHCDNVALACSRKADLVTDLGLDAESQAVIDAVLSETEEAPEWE
jgi:hypothetical protein